MCSSTTTLFYGTFVKAIPLFLAADAWPKLKPAFLALDMVSLRRSKGTLRFEQGRSIVAKLPVEVLELIKRELTQMEAREAAERLHHSVTPGPDSDIDCWTHDPECELFWGTHVDELCHDTFRHTVGMYTIAKNMASAVRTLLTDFRLCRPSTTILGLGENTFLDLDALIPLALPLGATSSFPVAHLPVMHEADTTHHVTKVSQQVLTLPPDAVQRFTGLFSTFSLTSIDPSHLVLQPHDTSKALPPPHEPKRADHGEFPVHPRADEVLKGEKSLKLDWHIWSLCDSCV